MRYHRSFAFKASYRALSTQGACHATAVLLTPCTSTCRGSKSAQLTIRMPRTLWSFNIHCHPSMRGSYTRRHKCLLCLQLPGLLVSSIAWSTILQLFALNTHAPPTALPSGVTHGPLVNPAGIEKVESHVADGLAKGGKVLVGGSKPENLADPLKGGYFYSPTVLAEATIDM